MPHNPLLTKSFVAEGALTKRRLVKMGSSNSQVKPAADGAAFILGVVDPAADVADKAPADIITSGMSDIEAGAAVALGDPITADAVGRAVKSAPGAGVNSNIAGFALEAATAAGDIISIQIAPSRIQG